MGHCTGVEQNRRSGPPGVLLAAHHQLARPCGRLPVHASQLVAVAILPRDHVVFPGRSHGASSRLAQSGPVTSERDGRKGNLCGHDGQGVGRGESSCRAAKAEGVDQLYGHRADDIAATQVAAQLVADISATTGLEAIHDKALGAAKLPRHLVLDQEEATRDP